MGRNDRHGRLARADSDLRRRPSDGYRTADRARFLALVQRAVATLQSDLRRHLVHTEVEIRDVPDPDSGDVDLTGDLVLARLQLPNPTHPVGRLTVVRRPLELRALDRSELQSDIALAVRHAVQDALGQPRDEP